MVSARTATRVEWRTVALIAAVYLSFALLTWFHAAIPHWLFILIGAYLATLHGSLQHEAIHGHPTPSAAANEALVTPGFWLWVPYRLYRDVHLAHHNDENLTSPFDDPESHYVSAAQWAQMSVLGRGFRWAYNTLLGRLLLAPWRNLLWSLRQFGVALRQGRRGALLAWGLHFLGAAIVLGWALAVAGVPLWLYLLAFVYGGMAGTSLRSFLEHQARPESRERTVAVEAGPVLSLMFLYNNLHILHHSEPGVAWYRLPARWRQRRADLLAANGGYRYAGYGEIALRYLLRPKEHPVHPGWQGIATLAPHGPLAVATAAPQETVPHEEAPVASPVVPPVAAGGPASAS